MKICLVSHGFPPLERTGVENYTAALAAAFAADGHGVEVFTPRRSELLPDFSTRREERDGYGVTWVTVNEGPSGPREMLDLPQVAERFGEFLDRERPHLVHFQHVIKLGTGTVLEARRRGIATVYTAHDYYAVCHRYTLLRPDLSHCEVRGDPMWCSLCDLALGYLNGLQRFGDYQMGVAPERLGREERETLAAILSDDPQAAGRTRAEFDEACDLRFELDAERARAFAALDRIIAPTEFLRDELVSGGVEREKIQVLPYGIPNGDLADVSPVRPPVEEGDSGDDAAPVRFGFLGGLAKHKGVDVLLEAFRAIDEGATLSVWGYSSDSEHVETLQELALEVGADWRGPYERAELPAILAQVDVVVVPSTWVENYPIVIREAFSARRPVVTSNFGALPESVRDGVDGLLFEVGDAASLEAALRRFVDEPDLLGKLVAGIEPVKDVAAQVKELYAIYADVVQERAPSELLTSLQDFEARHADLQELSNRELFERASRRLGALREALGVDLGEDGADPGALLAAALLRGSKAQVLLRDAQMQTEWMRETLQSHEQAERSLSEKLHWREGDLRTLAEERDWLRGAVDEQQAGMDELTKERDWLKGQLEAAQGEKTHLEQTLAGCENERDWLSGLRDELEKQVAWQKDILAARDEEIAWMKSKLSELLQTRGNLEELSAELRRSLEKADAGNRQLEADLQQTEENLLKARENLEATERLLVDTRGGLEAQLAEAGRDLESTRADLDSKQAELAETSVDLATRDALLAETTGALQEREEQLERTSEDLAATERNLLVTGQNLETAERNLALSQDQLRNTAELGLVSLRAQERLLGAGLVSLLREAGEATDDQDLEEILAHVPRDGAGFLELVRAAQASRERIRVLSDEVRWRRDEMRHAREAFKKPWTRALIFPTGLAKALRRWSVEEEPLAEKPEASAEHEPDASAERKEGGA